jgi:hypothetical protein
MLFLRDGKRGNTSKPISEKRLKELQRQSKEIQEVSSFFISPDRAPSSPSPQLIERSHTGSKTKHRSSVGKVKNCDKEQVISDSPVPQSDPECTKPMFISSYIPATQRASSRGSKTTTYLTWSTSPTHSPTQPKALSFLKTTRHEIQSSRTPESIRAILNNSGIFRGTSIRGYVDLPHVTEYGNDNSRRHDSKLSACETKGGANPCGNISPSLEPISEDTHSMTDAQVASLKQRWQALLGLDLQKHSPDWSPNPTAENAHTNTKENLVRERGNLVFGGKSIGANHQSLAVSDEIQSIYQRNPYQHGSHAPVILSPNPNERVSSKSRDAMPPPPRPMGFSVLCSKSSEHHTIRRTPQNGSSWRRESSPVREIVTDCDVVASSSIGSSAPRPCSQVLGTEAANDDKTTAYSFLPSASWLPLVHSPATCASAPRMPTPRQSAPHPLFVGQIVTMPARASEQSSSNQKTQVEESLTEYIARIEHESQNDLSEFGTECTDLAHASGHGGYVENSLLTGNDEDQLEDPTHEPPLPSQREKLSDHVEDGKWHELFHSDSTKCQILPHKGQNLSTSTSMSQIGEVEREEALEKEKSAMWKFWRPNHFINC